MPASMPLVSRPVPLATLWLNYKTGGMSPATYKITNILFHVLASFMVFILLSYLCRIHASLENNFIPLAASLLFLVHPVHTNAINNIVQRCVPLMAFFGFLGFYAFLRFLHEDKKIYYGLALLCLVLSVLSKAPGIAFIFIFFLYVIVFIEPKQRSKGLIACLSLSIIPILILLYFYQQHFNLQYSSLNPLQYLTIETRAVWIYWKLFLVPFPLQFIYDFSIDYNVAHHFTWLAIAGHTGLIGIGIYLLRFEKYRLPGFCILSAYLAILPESGLFPITVPVREYRTYMAYAFLSFALCFFCNQWLRRRKVFLLCLTTLYFFGLTAATYNRNSQINTIEKWHYDVVKSYQNDDLMNFYALQILSQKEFDHD